MIPIETYDEMLKKIRNRYGKKTQTIVILITRKGTPFFEENILKSLDYYHKRAKKEMDFYIPGYSYEWVRGHLKDEEKVKKVGDFEWWYSNSVFAEFITELETNTTLEFSGESELLIVDYSNDNLQFSNTIVLNLEQLLRDKTIASFNTLFETLFRGFQKKITASKISNEMGLKSLLGSIYTDVMVKNIPLGLGEVFNKTKSFAVKDLSK